MSKNNKIAAIVALALGASLLFTACNPECVDIFDCAPKANNTIQCISNKCTYTPDAGS